MNNKVNDIINNKIWEVTIHGDCEGRSTRNLGFYEGYIEDIAFYLHPKSVYNSLSFEKVYNINNKEVIKINESNITNYINKEIHLTLWDLSLLEKEEANYCVSKLFKNKSIIVSNSSEYVTIRKI